MRQRWRTLISGVCTRYERAETGAVLQADSWAAGALLLAMNIAVLFAENTRSDGFYTVYNRELREVQAMSFTQAQQAVAGKLETCQGIVALDTWQGESDEFFKALMREECVKAFGADFEQQLANGTLAISEQKTLDAYLQQEALQKLDAQLSYLLQYPDYLDTVHRNAQQMSAMSVFRKEGSFSVRNIEKTDHDYPEKVALSLDNDFAVELLVSDRLGSYSVLIFVAALVLLLMDERKRGLWPLVHSTKTGRARLACKRAAILLFGTAFGTLARTVGKLLIASALYGGCGDLSRNVQSISAFQGFPTVLSVGQLLLAMTALRIFGLWLVALLAWSVLQSVNHLPLALGVGGVLLAVEYALFQFIPDNFSLVFLRYLNVFAFVDMERVALHYLNLNIFGQPVQGLALTWMLAPLFAVLLVGANVLLSEKKKPVSRQNALLKLADRIRKPISRAVGRLHLLGRELHKILWQQKGIVVLLALVVYLFAVMQVPWADTSLYDTQTAAQANAMQGPITEKTLQNIDAQLAEYASWQNQEAAQTQLAALQSLRVTVEESLAAKDGRWLVNPAPTMALMNRNVDNYQRKNGLVLLLVLVLLLSGGFAIERQSNMTPLLHGSPRGSGRLWACKIGAAYLLTTLTVLLFQVRELVLIRQAYGAFCVNPPIQSLEYFSGITESITIGMGIGVYIALRLLTALAVASCVCCLSTLCRRSNTAVLVSTGAFVLPACMSYMGIAACDKLSFCTAFSPLECTQLGYAAVVLTGIIALLLSRLAWKKV